MKTDCQTNFIVKMRRVFLKNWMVAALFAAVSCGMVACDDDDDNGGTTPPPTEPDITAVCGEYTGTMAIVDVVAPVSDDGTDEPAGTSVDATVTNEAIEFADFPVRDLIVKILGTEEGVDEIIAAIGQIDYNVPYTAQISEDKASVAMTLKPEVLKLTLPGSGEEDPGTDIEVTIEATDGTYTLESKALEFGLAVAGVKVAGVDLPDFESFSLDFDLAKK